MYCAAPAPAVSSLFSCLGALSQALESLLRRSVVRPLCPRERNVRILIVCIVMSVVTVINTVSTTT